MYCFEAHRCTKYDCPVQRNLIRRCWEFLEKLNQRPVTIDDCPYAPCNKCNYKLGWDIGLIGDSLFPDDEPTSPEALIPLSSKVSSDKGQADKPVVTDKSTETKATGKGDSTKTSDDTLSKEEVGKLGLRFCHEVIYCPNPKCIVRRRQIIRCFAFFANRTPEQKAEMTCTDRICKDCFYKRGWDIGTLYEGLFEDIINKKKLNIQVANRSRQNSMIEIYLSELAKKPLNREQELELAKKIAGDSEAAELFLMANLKLVARIASRYKGRGLGIMDLIQEGNIGLIKAISKFDYTLGYRFSTYAAYWIKYYMQRGVANQSSTIRIPHHLLTVAHKIKRFIREFESEHYRAPSLKELSKSFGLEKDKILSVIRITQTPISIQARPGSSADEENEELEYFLSDAEALTPEELALETLKTEAVTKAINKLPERLRYIVENFYGFKEEQISLAEIGRRFQLSRERIRQLLQQALKLLEKDEFIIEHKPEN